MSSKSDKMQFVYIGIGVLATTIFGVSAVVIFNKRKRQDEYDYLLKVINANQDEETLSTMKGGAFDRDYYKQNPKCVSITPNEATEYAISLYNAKKWYDDDEQAVKSVFVELNSKCNLSRVADAFAGKYNKPLLVHLESFLDSEEMAQLVYKYTKNYK